MATWFAYYKDDPNHRACAVEDGAPFKEMAERFDACTEAKEVNGRAVIGMYIMDMDSEQQDVMRYSGAVPLNFPKRHKAWLVSVSETP